MKTLAAVIAVVVTALWLNTWPSWLVTGLIVMRLCTLPDPQEGGEADR